MNRLKVQLGALEDWFGQHPRVLTALSGGVDSCLVAFLARRFLDKEDAVAVISASASLKAADLADARSFCDTHDIRLVEVNAREIEDPRYRANPADRCYYCKSALYDTLSNLVADRFPGYRMINGHNASDLGDYRPGMTAADEKKVLSPLAECSMSKADIRRMARHFGLSTWDKPASPCLSSRFPYGQSIDEEKLRQVERGEDILLAHGFREVRLRHYGEEARVEVPAEQLDRLRTLFPAIREQILALGFQRCLMDEEGLVSGKLNRALGHAK